MPKLLKNVEKFIKRLIILKMPKFKIEYEANLNETLCSLEIKDAFDEENENFSAMSMQYKGLYVSEVVYKAFVETSEEETKAAAATGIKMVRKCLTPVPRPLHFTVDHPLVDHHGKSHFVVIKIITVFLQHFLCLS